MKLSPVARKAQLSEPMLRLLIAVTTGSTLLYGYGSTTGFHYFKRGGFPRFPATNTVEALISRSLLERRRADFGKLRTVIPTTEGRRVSLEQRHYEKEQNDETAS